MNKSSNDVEMPMSVRCFFSILLFLIAFVVHNIPRTVVHFTCETLSKTVNEAVKLLSLYN
jgi:hypothetical protein